MLDRNLFASLPSNAKILDCVCGSAQDSEVFAKLGIDVAGIDLTPEFVAMARKRVATAKFTQMDMRDASFSADTFGGGWVSFSLLHIHQTDVPELFNNLKRIMKVSGKTMIALHRGPKTNWVIANISSVNHNYDVQEWTQSDLERIIKDNEFEVDYSRPFERSGARIPLRSILTLLYSR